MKKSIAKKMKKNRTKKNKRGGTKNTRFSQPVSIWILTKTLDKLQILKSNIVQLVNNQICSNIVKKFDLFNASTDSKKINTECFLLVIISILADMLKSHCEIIIKGGLAVQFSLATLFKNNNITDESIYSLMKTNDVREELSNLFKTNKSYAADEEMIDIVYTTNDIDILINPKNKNEEPYYYAKQISDMLVWLFEDIKEDNEFIHVISVLDKTNAITPSEQIIKISMTEKSKRPKYTAIVDININLPDEKYYKPTNIVSIDVPVANTTLKGVFIFVDIKPLMLDRLHHIIHYRDTVEEIINATKQITGDTKISDIFKTNPNFKYLMSNYRSTNALIEGQLIVEITKKPQDTINNMKKNILNEYLENFEKSDKELIHDFLFTRIV